MDYLNRLPREIQLEIFKRLNLEDLINLNEADPKIENLTCDRSVVRYIKTNGSCLDQNSVLKFLKRPECRQFCETLDISGLYWINKSIVVRIIMNYKNVHTLYTWNTELNLQDTLSCISHMESVKRVSMNFKIPKNNTDFLKNLAHRKALSQLTHLYLYLLDFNDSQFSQLIRMCSNLKVLHICHHLHYIENTSIRRLIDKSIDEIIIDPLFRSKRTFESRNKIDYKPEAELSYLTDLRIRLFIPRNVMLLPLKTLRSGNLSSRYLTELNLININCYTPHLVKELMLQSFVGDFLKYLKHFSVSTCAFKEEICEIKNHNETEQIRKKMRIGLGHARSPPENSLFSIMVDNLKLIETFELLEHKCSEFADYCFNEYDLQHMERWHELKRLTIVDVEFYNTIFLEKISSSCQVKHIEIFTPPHINLILPISRSLSNNKHLVDFIYRRKTVVQNSGMLLRPIFNNLKNVERVMIFLGDIANSKDINDIVIPDRITFIGFQIFRMQTVVMKQINEHLKKIRRPNFRFLVSKSGDNIKGFCQIKHLREIFIPTSRPANFSWFLHD